MARNRGAFKLSYPGGFMVMMGVLVLGSLSQMPAHWRPTLYALFVLGIVVFVLFLVRIVLWQTPEEREELSRE